MAFDPRSVYPKFRDVKVHLKRVLLTPFRAYTTFCSRRSARTRGGVLKGVPHGERRSVACFDDLDDVGWNCREMWLTCGTERHVQLPRGPSESEYRIFKAILLSTA